MIRIDTRALARLSLALGLACLTACADGRARRASACPDVNGLSVLVAVGAEQPVTLVGPPWSAPTHVALAEGRPPRRVEVTRRIWPTGQVDFLVPPSSEDADGGEARRVTIYLGPYRGDEAELSLRCVARWCRGELQALAPDVWEHGFTVLRRREPWLELFLSTDTGGSERRVRLRASRCPANAERIVSSVR